MTYGCCPQEIPGAQLPAGLGVGWEIKAPVEAWQEVVSGAVGESGGARTLSPETPAWVTPDWLLQRVRGPQERDRF